MVKESGLDRLGITVQESALDRFAHTVNESAFLVNFFSFLVVETFIVRK